MVWSRGKSGREAEHVPGRVPHAVGVIPTTAPGTTPRAVQGLSPSHAPAPAARTTSGEAHEDGSVIER
jgi:hypothetical protein